MKNQRVLFATLVVLLWTVNSLELQPYEFELRSTVAISKHRVPLLQNLTRDRNTKIQRSGKTFDIRVISCDPFDVEIKGQSLFPGAAMDADLQTVKVRVRYQRFADVDSIEKWLESQTRPSRLSDRCQTIKSQLQAAQWRLESLDHTKRVLIADQTRRAEQLALKADDPTDNIKLVGFRRTESNMDATQSVIDSLTDKRKLEQQAILDLSNDLTREIAISNGFLQFSGSPKWFPVADSVGWRRGVAFIVLSLATWGVCRFVFLSCHGWSVAAGALLTALFRVRSRQLAIPHWGHAELMLTDDTAHQGILLQHHFTGGEGNRLLPTSVFSVGPRFRVNSWVRTCFTTGFAAWASLVVLRFVFDPAWRSLFVTAPLAAISNLVSGVGL